MRNYKDIKAFQLAEELTLQIYEATQTFPKEEIYGLTSQIRRAAVSVGANIVEGASRQHKKDYLNFLFNARASLVEVEYFLHLSYKLNYLNEKLYKGVDHTREETAKTLFGLIRAVESDLKKVSSL